MPNNEFGDFQTNPALASRVVALVSQLADKPATIVEPTCGQGNFIRASLDAFPSSVVHGLEIQASYIRELEGRFQFCPNFILHKADYFAFDWNDLIPCVAKPVWVIGNPPWVTNTQLMKSASSNLPRKSPQSHLRGIEAQTGKSNFDISESMLRDWFGWCSTSDGTLAVICKTSVARKVLQWWWKQDKSAPQARIHLIDAKAEFDATVAACVLVCTFGKGDLRKTCELYDNIDARIPASTFGLIDGYLVADEPRYRRGRTMLGAAQPRWRSGIKHDAGSILELRESAGILRNKLGEQVLIESRFLYPLVKGSDLARVESLRPSRAMLVPQTFIGEDTSRIEQAAPRTWRYLKRYEQMFTSRKSSIYKNKGKFTIFGVGEYTFLPWKIAIGALYKGLDFRVIAPIKGKPVVFDDTVYFIGFYTESEARQALAKLQMKPVRDFISSMVFWDDMRPIKTEILNRINLSGLTQKAAA